LLSFGAVASPLLAPSASASMAAFAAAAWVTQVGPFSKVEKLQGWRSQNQDKPSKRWNEKREGQCEGGKAS
jgi:hypothetical protein